MKTLSSTPQYQQVADTLRQRIARAEYRVGDVIPSSTELEMLFSVSNITIRKALAILSDEGLVTGYRGIGTVIKAEPQDLRLKIAVTGGSRHPLTVSRRRRATVDVTPPALGQQRHHLLPRQFCTPRKDDGN
jgi:DNA-binding GntR family transcriptional regulator